jgi:hypothetical protein
MNSTAALRRRIRPLRLCIVLLFVGGATYVEFVLQQSPSLPDIALWVIVVPLLLSTAVEGVRDHPLYQRALFSGFVVIGGAQYLDGEWVLLSMLFVLAGIVGLLLEFRR